MHYIRAQVAGRGVLSSKQVAAGKNGRRVHVAGAVITRRRPGTAKGFCFVTLEDEVGVTNLILAAPVFQANSVTVMQEPFLLVEGILQNADGTVAVNVERIHSLCASRPCRGRPKKRTGREVPRNRPGPRGH